MWLREQPGIDVEVVQLIDLAGRRLTSSSLLWWHYARDPELPSAAFDPRLLAAIRAHIASDGALLLTLFAAQYTVPLGLETRGPDEVRFAPGSEFTRWADDDRLLVGVQSYAGHPLLRRFWGGTYIHAPSPELSYPVARYSASTWPDQGRVWAVGRRAIRIDSDTKVGLEYPPDEGHRGGLVVTLGQGPYFADRSNRQRLHLELLFTDLLTYLEGSLPPTPTGAAIPSTGAPVVALTPSDVGGPVAPTAAAAAPETIEGGADRPSLGTTATYWRQAGTEELQIGIAIEQSAGLGPQLADGRATLEAVAAARSGLELETTPASDGSRTPFNLASPRTLINGDQNGRIDEVWAYPGRVAVGLRFGLAAPGGAPTWLHETRALSFVARPEGVSFSYELDGAEVNMHLAVRRDVGGLVALFEIADEPGRGGRELVASWTAEAQPMWPHAEADPPQIVWDSTVQALAWRNSPSRGAGINVYAGFGRPPTDVVYSNAGAGDGPTSTTSPGTPAADVSPVTLRVALPTDETAAIVFSLAATTGRDADLAGARTSYLELLSDPASVWAENANHYRRLLAETLDVVTPDPTFNEAFLWAKAGLEALRVTAPDVGTGIVAGYGASPESRLDDRGAASWTRDNDFERRPGYAWFFGRDGLWSGLAADAYGGTDLASETLRLLARYQDVDGKIAHEISPKAAVHYDAADSTPLFLIGLDHHIRATGDRELLRSLWPSVRAAFAFLESTDTDGDGLIENTGIGHGWIDEGPVNRGHTTLYLAGLWAASLDALERLASWIDDEELLARARELAPTVRRALDEIFWDDDLRHFRQGLRADGTAIEERTVMPAVPMLFRVLDDAKGRAVLARLAGAEFTTDWGVRMSEASHPAYDPTSNHRGAVWPLYGGWVSLAGYVSHLPLPAYMRLNQNLRLYRHGNLGYITEGLHGDRFEAVGTTSHRAWSQAMAILPAVEGMLGIRQDAMQGTLRFAPHLPGGWDNVVAQPVRVGKDAFRITFERQPERSSFHIERLAGGSDIVFELALPVPRDVLVNLDRDATSGVAITDPGEDIVDLVVEKEAVVRATLTESEGHVAFRHSPFPQIIPPSPALEPGAGSTQLRIIDSIFRSGYQTLKVEGLPGREYRVALATPWRIAAVRGVPGASVVAAGPGRATFAFRIPGAGESYQSAELQIEFRR